MAVKDMGACEIYPQTVAHNPNGRFVVVCGDGEYIIYTSMALRNKAFGPAQEFVWAADSSEYAIREASGAMKLFRNFKERKSFTPEYGAEGIFGGHMLGVRTSAGFTLYDWESIELIRHIDVQPKFVFWNESGSLMCLATADSYFILSVDTALIQTTLEHDRSVIGEDGIEAAFEVLAEVTEEVKTGTWVGDCFIYTNSVNRINYYVGGEIVTVAHLDRPMYLLGYVPKENRLYLGDKELNVTSYALQLSVLEYQTAVMRRDFDVADRVLPTVPKEHRTRVAHFLEKQGFKEQALQVSTDPEHRFELALQIGRLDVASALARDSDSAQKWSQLADAASAKNDLELVRECLKRANDFGGQLLLATSAGDEDLLKELAVNSQTAGKHNVAFLSEFLLGDLDRCLDILLETDRIPEAAFFARTYMPSRVQEVVELWRDKLGQVNEKAGQSLADPVQYENLFPGFQEALKTEEYLAQTERKELRLARDAMQVPLNIERDAVKELEEGQGFSGHAGGAVEDKYERKVVKEEKVPEREILQPQQIKEEPRERKSSLDEFDIDLEGMNLDDENIDTSVSGG